MIGDNPDFVRRLREVLPRGWFSDTAPTANAVLSALASAWQFVFQLIDAIARLTRISTASGVFVDAISLDYFGNGLPRRVGESDAEFIQRIKQELLRSRGTRSALTIVLQQLTGKTPQIFEPARPADVGGYSVGGCGYNVAGGYGSLRLPYSCFITAYRPNGQGIADFAGYATGGDVVYGSLAMVNSPVRDTDIYETAAAVLPLGCTAWLNIK